MLDSHQIDTIIHILHLHAANRLFSNLNKAKKDENWQYPGDSGYNFSESSTLPSNIYDKE